MNQTSNKNKYILPDGTVAIFNREKLKKAIYREVSNSGNRTSQQAMLQHIAEQTGISFSAIKHWSAGHNAPSDLDKVHDLAEALHVDMMDLLDTEKENNEMTTNIPVKDIDFTTTKNTIRDIYTNMADYIEMFRLAGNTDMSGSTLTPLFTPMYMSLMHARLDLPKDTFSALGSFARNFLQQLPGYMVYDSMVACDEISEEIDTADAFYDVYSYAYNCPPCAPWSSGFTLSIDPHSLDCKAFESAIKKQYIWNNDNELWEIPNEIIIEEAYLRLEEILKEYLVN